MKEIKMQIMGDVMLNVLRAMNVYESAAFKASKDGKGNWMRFQAKVLYCHDIADTMEVHAKI